MGHPWFSLRFLEFILVENLKKVPVLWVFEQNCAWVLNFLSFFLVEFLQFCSKKKAWCNKSLSFCKENFLKAPEHWVLHLKTLEFCENAQKSLFYWFSVQNKEYTLQKLRPIFTKTRPNLSSWIFFKGKTFGILTLDDGCKVSVRNGWKNRRFRHKLGRDM